MVLCPAEALFGEDWTGAQFMLESAPMTRRYFGSSLLPLPPGGPDRLSSPLTNPNKTASAKAWRFLFLGDGNDAHPSTAIPRYPPTRPRLRRRAHPGRRPLPPPEHLIRFFPIQGTPVEVQISETRRQVRQILQGRSDRLLVVMGLARSTTRQRHSPMPSAWRPNGKACRRPRVLMASTSRNRAPRSLEGADQRPLPQRQLPHQRGLRIARDLLVRINQAGVPRAAEFPRCDLAQYIATSSRGAPIGARTTESQVHRELASGLSAAVGFKNGTDAT